MPETLEIRVFCPFWFPSFIRRGPKQLSDDFLERRGAKVTASVPVLE